MKKNLNLLLFILIGLSGTAQKEWVNWYYGGDNLLTFKNGYPEIVHGFVQPQPTQYDGFNYFYWGGAFVESVSYSDPATGTMRFLISTGTAFGPDYKAFPASRTKRLRGCMEDEKAYHIVPFSNNADKFYVIQFQDCVGDLLAQQSGLQVKCPNSFGLAYSIIDMSLNGGLGDFTVINQQIATNLTGQMTLVKHANGHDVWVIVHPANSNTFTARLITDQGIGAPINSNLGPVVTGSYANHEGYLTASRDGKMLAGYSAASKTVQLFDFDNSNGAISNYRPLAYKEYVVSMQFSPDNSKLYYCGFSSLYQYDLSQPDIENSLTKVGVGYGNIVAMQLAVDGKIYVSRLSFSSGNSSKDYVGIIQCPNLPQYACNFDPKGIEASHMNFAPLINDIVNDPKAPPITKFSLGNDTTLCSDPITITAPPGWQSYKWSTGETTRSITVSKPDLYYVITGNTGFSCPSGYGYINVTDRASKLDLGKDTSLCPKASYLLHIHEDYSNIVWQNGGHTRDSIITKSSNLIITANDKGGCFTSDTISVYFKADPSADFGKDTTLCNNTALVLSLYPQANAFYSGIYKWQDGSNKDKYTVTQTGTYWGTVSFNGCTVSDTINVTYVNANSVNLGKDTTACAGDSVLLQANIDNADYLWNTGARTKSIYAKADGNYWVRVSTAICSLSDTIAVRFNYKPVFTLGNDTAVCAKEKLVLLPAVGAGKYTWQDGTTAPSYTVQSPGLYWLKFTANGCTVSDSINITYKELPKLNLGADTGFCKNQAFQINAYDPSIASYLWQDQSNQPSYTVSKAGTYSLTVTGVNGCMNRDTIAITTTAPPVFSLGRDTVLCDTKTIAYHFNLPNANYLWSDGSTQGNYTISSAGEYALLVTQAGCKAADTVNIRYKPMPQVYLGKDTSVCTGSVVVLNAANAGATYKWQNGSVLPSYTVTAAGTYYVTVNLQGCEKADSIFVVYKDKPLFTLGDDQFLCKGQELLLQPSVKNAGSYLWQNGSTAPTFLVSNAGAYNLSATNECGTASSKLNITVGVCSLNMPTAFTPNRDGVNDVFRVKYPVETKQFSFVIYNKWGQKIFETTNIKQGWDGTYKGRLQDIGGYVWIISYLDSNGVMQRANGTVMLLR